MLSLLWSLFATFFTIGLFNFGGGGAMLSLIQSKVVTEFGWISEAEFTDIVAISQSTPGPIGINCATYVGYEVMDGCGFSSLISVLGSATATFAVVLPSFLLFFLIIRVFTRFHHTRTFSTTMTALKPAVAGLIAAAAMVLIVSVNLGGDWQFQLRTESFPDWKAWVIFATVLICSLTKKVGPVPLLLASALLGVLLF